ncbi:MAG: hypothetical protein GXP13_07945 [Gammaproteobacteria bacterium]|nr:hypothetical protein [Gammaproteobacteria bacterium]
MKFTRSIILILMSLFLISCSDNNDKWFSENVISHPGWFQEMPFTEVDTVEGVSTVWQSKKRCCVDEGMLEQNNREFYKACVKAINKHRSDDELVVRCLWLMGGAVSSPDKIKIKQYLIDNYFYHKASTSHCVNCKSGDVTARVSQSLSGFYYSSDLNKAIDIIEKPLRDELVDISLWIQVEMYEYLGKLYLKAGLTEERKDTFNKAYKRLSLQREHKTLKRRIGGLDKIYKKINEG